MRCAKACRLPMPPPPIESAFAYPTGGLAK